MHPLVLAGLLGGCALLAIFSLVEPKVPSPMVPVTLFQSRPFLGATILTLLLYGALGIFFFLFPMALFRGGGCSPTAAGSALLPMILLMFFLSRWAGGLVKRYGGKIPLVVGPAIVAAGFCLFAVLSFGGSYWRTYFPASLLVGFGMAITVAPLTTVVMNSAIPPPTAPSSRITNPAPPLPALPALPLFATSFAP